ncbi:hypothetical protein D9758_006245 [Tetrapyrgos nigripes]|uniref:Uncharacterized protein n=1 Tax=Tetrapyrgos nigripes TaxID=182062 RepID=A0A8H5LL27_9AGAR|nr:hypothetical protein D9758_006245 [Tetrapyrgos nigripes]
MASSFPITLTRHSVSVAGSTRRGRPWPGPSSKTERGRKRKSRRALPQPIPLTTSRYNVVPSAPVPYYYPTGTPKPFYSCSPAPSLGSDPEPMDLDWPLGDTGTSPAINIAMDVDEEYTSMDVDSDSDIYHSNLIDYRLIRRFSYVMSPSRWSDRSFAFGCGMMAYAWHTSTSPSFMYSPWSVRC